jgi:hypothetical protein
MKSRLPCPARPRRGFHPGLRRFRRPPGGGWVETRTFPRVPHRPLTSGRCFTRGYSPPPRWGEERPLQSLPGCGGFPAVGRRLPFWQCVGCVLRTHADYSHRRRRLQQRPLDRGGDLDGGEVGEGPPPLAPRPPSLSADPRPPPPVLSPGGGRLVLALRLPSGYNNMRQHEAARVVARCPQGERYGWGGQFQQETSVCHRAEEQ